MKVEMLVKRWFQPSAVSVVVRGGRWAGPAVLLGVGCGVRTARVAPDGRRCPASGRHPRENVTRCRNVPAPEAQPNRDALVNARLSGATGTNYKN